MVGDARSDTSVQHFGCWALANVGWGQADVQRFAREEGAIEAIQARSVVGWCNFSCGSYIVALSMDDLTRISALGKQERVKWRVTK